MSNNYMFKSTYQRLLKRLQKIGEERTNLIKELEVAAGFGDLRENSEFDSAMERQGQLNREAEYIHKRIFNVQFIDDIKINNNRVSIGTIVKLVDINDCYCRCYCIVGCIEDDCIDGCIKVTTGSPVANKLVGKNKGDFVYDLDKDSRIFEVVEIKQIREY